ncbi:MAG: hypothetical protein EXS35_15070 [Pedosphaera sp.]|nr:hypothetical protein [Pedosphaera sp.]
MTLEHVPPTEVGKRRHAWFKEHAKPGMTFGEACELNEQALRLFPVSEKERRLKWESLMTMPESVL